MLYGTARTPSSTDSLWVQQLTGQQYILQLEVSMYHHWARFVQIPAQQPRYATSWVHKPKCCAVILYSGTVGQTGKQLRALPVLAGLGNCTLISDISTNHHHCGKTHLNPRAICRQMSNASALLYVLRPFPNISLVTSCFRVPPAMYSCNTPATATQQGTCQT